MSCVHDKSKTKQENIYIYIYMGWKFESCIRKAKQNKKSTLGLVHEQSFDYFLDELIFTLLRVWGSEFGIPNQYTGFKIALDTTLVCMYVCMYVCT